MLSKQEEQNLLSSNKKLLFRCDSTSENGLGHVSRCIALAEAFQEFGYESFFLGKYAEHARRLLSASDVSFIEFCPEKHKEDITTLEVAHALGVRGVIIDSYDISSSQVDQLCKNSLPIIVIDDFGRLKTTQCAAILNFTVNAANIGYPCGGTLCLLGPDFLLVRSSLRSLKRQRKKQSRDVRRVLLAIGGTDVSNLSSKVVLALISIAPYLRIRVVVGKSFTWKANLLSLLSRFKEGGKVLTQLSSLADEFAQADVCICGGGLTKYEAAYLCIPTAVISQNEDQARETWQFAEKGLAFDLGLGAETSELQLREKLKTFIRDSSLRYRLSLTGRSVFPADPTMNAVQALGRILQP